MFTGFVFAGLTSRSPQHQAAFDQLAAPLSPAADLVPGKSIRFEATLEGKPALVGPVSKSACIAHSTQVFRQLSSQTAGGEFSEQSIFEGSDGPEHLIFQAGEVQFICPRKRCRAVDAQVTGQQTSSPPSFLSETQLRVPMGERVVGFRVEETLYLPGAHFVLQGLVQSRQGRVIALDSVSCLLGTHQELVARAQQKFSGGQRFRLIFGLVTMLALLASVFFLSTGFRLVRVS